MPPPTLSSAIFVRMLLAGRYFDEIGKSLANVLVAFASAYLVGCDHRHHLAWLQDARARFSIRCLRTYYAIPVFAFYPLFIVMFGLGDGPQVLIGFLLGDRRRDRHHAQRPRPRPAGVEENSVESAGSMRCRRRCTSPCRSVRLTC